MFKEQQGKQRGGKARAGRNEVRDLTRSQNMQCLVAHSEQGRDRI